jgi:phosphoglycerate dehydrogenase-like enzyme
VSEARVSTRHGDTGATAAARPDEGPIRVGLIGLGAIGIGIARLAQRNVVTILGALVRDTSRDRGPHAPSVVRSLAELLASSRRSSSKAPAMPRFASTVRRSFAPVVISWP